MPKPIAGEIRDEFERIDRAIYASHTATRGLDALANNLWNLDNFQDHKLTLELIADAVAIRRALEVRRHELQKKHPELATL